MRRTDAGIGWVTGLLATPENYYVNIHTTVNSGGFMRGPLQASHLVLRPILSPAFEVPAVAIDAEGAALVDITVNRDANGTHHVGHRHVRCELSLPPGTAVTLTGLHFHNAAVGVNGPVVIDTGHEHDDPIRHGSWRSRETFSELLKFPAPTPPASPR